MKNKILSVLLFTFAFFVMHDYFVQDISTNLGYEHCYTEHTQSPQDLKLHIHEAMHTLLALNSEEESVTEQKLSDSKPSIFLAGLISHINSVPQRPPLI